MVRNWLQIFHKVVFGTCSQPLLLRWCKACIERDQRMVFAIKNLKGTQVHRQLLYCREESFGPVTWPNNDWDPQVGGTMVVWRVTRWCFSEAASSKQCHQGTTWYVGWRGQGWCCRGSRGERKPGQESWEDVADRRVPTHLWGECSNHLRAKRYPPTVKDPRGTLSRKFGNILAQVQRGQVRELVCTEVC